MRSLVSLIAVSLATWGASAQAQTILRPPPLTQGWQPSFQAPIDWSAGTSGEAFSIGRPPVVYTCPMPVLRPQSAARDRTPVKGIPGLEPMPVVGSGCSNPLDAKP